MQSADIVSENIAFIAQRWPECLTEAKDENGKLRTVIDFDKLRQLLSSDATGEGQERYQFTWPDKRHAIRLANTPTTNTLRPCREESVDFDNTQNLYIEGDNLEVLKLLRESYLGKVKMIYIDPPYNTGGDFVYKDNFIKKSSDYAEISGSYDEEGNQVVDEFEKNADSNGRFHTDWLNMIYPRLKVARDLMAENGVIFISIDDNEVDNLKKICDEVFGASNFIDIYNWAKTETPENLSIKCRQIIEYVLCYQKNKDSARFRGIQKYSSSSNGLLNQPNAVGVLQFPANKVTTKISDGIIPKGEYGTDRYNVVLLDDVEVKNGLFVNEFRLKAKFKWQQSYLDNEINNGTVISIPTMNFSPSYEKREYAPEVPTNLINSKVGVGTNENAGEYQLQLFKKKVFNFPKPTSLMQYLFGFLDEKDKPYLVLDFFSGSASTAESIMNMNLERSANPINYILVQWQEDLNKTLKNTTSASQKEIIGNAIELCDNLGVPHVLTEIAKERIRRAGKKIKEEHPDWNGDTGFRVLKLDSSNMENVFYTPAETTEQTLFADNIKPDRTGEDLLFQVMMELGIPLSDQVENMVLAGKTVWNVGQGYLMACFEPDVTEDTITAIAKQQPQYFVMADRSLASDNVADNFDQLFEEYSPTTIRKIL
jgi:adenine-specific DNA-methyltransferase